MVPVDQMFVLVETDAAKPIRPQDQWIISHQSGVAQER